MQHGKVHVIGVDLQNFSGIPIALLEKCRAIVVSNRFLNMLQERGTDTSNYELIPITPLADAAERIRSCLDDGDVAVLASGDPLFFGIGRRLLDMFGRENTRIYPAPSSVQYAFARFGIPWDDAFFVSLHGRNPENRVGTLLAKTKTAVLTDAHNRPEVIARDLLDFLGDNEAHYTIHVAENLGMENERLVTGTLKEIADLHCGSLCCMLLLRKSTLAHSCSLTPSLGLTEEDIVHSRGLITKSEVRAAALHALAIPGNSILWDIGAGSGSISLEAARMHEDMLVYSIEKEPEQQQNILANMRKYDVANMKLISSKAPEGLFDLPRPHRVFIGGSGGNMAEIIAECEKRLYPGGRIVVTAVLEKTRREAPDLLYSSGLHVEMHRIEVQRMTYPAEEITSFNPITIIIGRKSLT